METLHTVGVWMMSISMSLIIFALLVGVFMDRPKKDPHKR